jgi:hypothetical protein
MAFFTRRENTIYLSSEYTTILMFFAQLFSAFPGTSLDPDERSM